MGTIILQPTQIPNAWDAIKIATYSTRPQKMNLEQTSRYFHRLLVSLLTGESQCFVEYEEDENRTVKAILITKIVNDELGYKTLDLDCLYSFQTTSLEEWARRYELVEKFAIQQGCDSIVGRASVPKVIEMAKLVGFEEFATIIVRRLK